MNDVKDVDAPTQIKLRNLMTWYLREIRTSIHYVECIMRFDIRQTSREIENNAKNERLHNDQTDQIRSVF